MNACLDINNIKNYNIFLNKKIPNTVIDNSYFIRINYSNELFTLSGLLVYLKINIKNTERYFNKFKYNFDLSDNLTIIDKLIKLEKLLLENEKFKHLEKNYKLKEQLYNLNIRTFEHIDSYNNNLTFLLKISGIWLTDTQCGLTFKFLPYKSIS